LREEVAALRARLNALTTLPPSASGPLPLQAEPSLAAKTPPRQMPLFGPLHGPGLPQVDHESSLQAKVGLYRTLFAGRSDVYAYRWEPGQDTQEFADFRGGGRVDADPGQELQDQYLLAATLKGCEQLRDRDAVLSQEPVRVRFTLPSSVGLNEHGGGGHAMGSRIPHSPDAGVAAPLKSALLQVRLQRHRGVHLACIHSRKTREKVIPGQPVRKLAVPGVAGSRWRDHSP
jgi:hypothetical protein